MTTIPVFKKGTARRLKDLSTQPIPRLRGRDGIEENPEDGLTIYVVKIGTDPVPAAEEDGGDLIPGKLALPVCRVTHPTDEDTEDPIVEEDGDDPLEIDVYNFSTTPSATEVFALVFQERITGRHILVTGGESCDCKEIHEIRIDGTATAGTITVAYTVGGTSGSASIAYNSSSASAKTALISGHSFFTSSNINVYDGPLPNTGLYVVFGDDLAGQSIPLPTVTGSPTGGGVGKAYRISAGGDLT